MHRVITGYEVRAIAVAVQVFSGMGIQVCTYEYDGVKVLSDHWLSSSEDERRMILEEVTKVIDERMFGGRAGGVVRLAETAMDYDLYESDMVTAGGEGPVMVYSNPLFGCVQGVNMCDGGAEGSGGA